MDLWIRGLAVSFASAVMFVFATTAVLAQFGDVARFPRWSRACVLPRAATGGGRVRDSFVYAVMAPFSPLLAVAVIQDSLTLQNLAVASLGLISLVAIAAWALYLLRSSWRSSVVQ